MGYGLGSAGGKQLAYKPIKRIRKFKKEFSSLYTNATSTRGDCVITSSSRRMTNAPGTLTYREGSPKAKFLSDDGRTSFGFSLREVTAESVGSRVHNITIP